VNLIDQGINLVTIEEETVKERFKEMKPVLERRHFSNE